MLLRELPGLSYDDLQRLPAQVANRFLILIEEQRLEHAMQAKGGPGGGVTVGNDG